MILTTCPACAAPLAHDAPRCVRCHTRYCNSTCQHDHWRRGHKQMCKKIHRGGNAEQYNADKKYKEAVAVAVEACADDTKGQKCYICLEAVHPHTGEGLVRGCGCGDRDGVSSPELGVAHVSCLARQAKILMEEGVEEVRANNLDENAWNVRWRRWYTCGLCEQRYHGVVRCALGWACWKTYVGQSEAGPFRRPAMNLLGDGLNDAQHYEDALTVREAELATYRRLGAREHTILVVQSNIATTLRELGRLEEAVRMRRDVYSRTLKLWGEEHTETLNEASNYANCLVTLRRFEETKSLLRKIMPVAQRVIGESHELTLTMRRCYARALWTNTDDLREAVTTLQDASRIARRVMGVSHPLTAAIEYDLKVSQRALARKTPPRGTD